MNPTTKRMIAILGLVGVAVTGAPVVASAGGATLYQLTENMRVVERHREHKTKLPVVTRRIAAGALAGFATPGTPLCPDDEEFQSSTALSTDGCWVNVLGQDNISLTTGLGTLAGNFTTVVQGDNPADAPERAVLKGEFRGQMDFSPAIVGKVTPTPFGPIVLPHPYGTVEGRVKAHRGRRAAFTGVFRLPFVGNAELVQGTGVTLRQILCPATPNTGPDVDLFEGIDLVYLDNVEEAGMPAGKCLNIKPDELSLGAPVVRFDVKF
jgi:hypothetical protein